jgi:hypothetical protein
VCAPTSYSLYVLRNILYNGPYLLVCLESLLFDGKIIAHERKRDNLRSDGDVGRKFYSAKMRLLYDADAPNPTV